LQRREGEANGADRGLPPIGTYLRPNATHAAGATGFTVANWVGVEKVYSDLGAPLLCEGRAWGDLTV